MSVDVHTNPSATTPEAAPLPPRLALRPRAFPEPKRLRRADPLLVGAVLMAAALRLVGLGDRPLAFGELAGWQAATGPFAGLADIAASHAQPPLPALLVHLTALLVGPSELSVRLPSAFAGVLLVALMAPLGRRLGGPPLARWAAWIAATSPFLIFYDRISGGYALTALLATLSTWCYLFLPTGRRWPAIGFTIFSALLAWTSHGALAVLLAQAAFLYVRRAPRRSWLPWSIGALVAVGSALPWAGRFSEQAAIASAPASGASLVAFVLRVLYPFNAFGIGETMYPWQPVGALGLALVLALAVAGLVRLPRSGRQFVVIFLLLPLLWTAMFTALTGPRVDIVSVSFRDLYAWPAFGLLLAAGVVALTGWRRRLAFAGLAAVAAFGLGAYFQGRDFSHPVYILPVREVISLVDARAEPGDILIADPESLIGHYARLRPGQVPVYDAATPDEVERIIEQTAPRRVWLATVEQEGQPAASTLTSALAGQYRRLEVQPYLEQDPTAVFLKEHLLGHQTYDAKLMLCLFQRAG